MHDRGQSCVIVVSQSVNLQQFRFIKRYYLENIRSAGAHLSYYDCINKYRAVGLSINMHEYVIRLLIVMIILIVMIYLFMHVDMAYLYSHVNVH